MKNALTLKGRQRQKTGSNAARNLRKAGLMPAIIYGHKKKVVSISLNRHDFVEGLHHGARLMSIELDGRNETVFVRDVQYDYLGSDIIHADLVRVDVTEKITVDVRLEIKGTPVGAEEGGIVETHTDHLEIECKVTEVPESLIVSVKELGIGDALHAKDVSLPEGSTLVSDPELLLVTCSTIAPEEEAEAEEAEEEVSKQPEVIGEEEKQDQAEQAETDQEKTK